MISRRVSTRARRRFPLFFIEKLSLLTRPQTKSLGRKYYIPYFGSLKITQAFEKINPFLKLFLIIFYFSVSITPFSVFIMEINCHFCFF